MAGTSEKRRDAMCAPRIIVLFPTGMCPPSGQESTPQHQCGDLGSLDICLCGLAPSSAAVASGGSLRERLRAPGEPGRGAARETWGATLMDARGAAGRQAESARWEEPERGFLVRVVRRPV